MRTRPQLAFLGGLVGAASLALPWARPGRNVLEWTAEGVGLRLLGDHPLLWLVVAAAVISLAAGLLPLASRLRGDLLLAAGAIGLAGSVLPGATANLPFGIGTATAAIAFIIVAGEGLSVSGRFRADTFLAGTLLGSAVFVLVFIAYPLAMVLRESVTVGGVLSLDNLSRTISSPIFWSLLDPLYDWDPFLGASIAAGVVLTLAGLWPRRANLTQRLAAAVILAALAFLIVLLIQAFGAFRNSLLLAAVVSTISVTLGLGFALLEHRSRYRLGPVFRTLAIIPIITPPLVPALALIYMFGRQGFISRQIFGMDTSAFFGITGVGAAQVLEFTPIAYLVMSGTVRALDAHLEEAAATLRAAPWERLRTVIWPLLRPGLANAFLLTTIESLADFANPLILGGADSFLATEVFYAIEGRFDQGEAAAYGTVLLLLTFTVFGLQRWWLGTRSYVTVTGKPAGRQATPLPGLLEYPLLGVFTLWTVLTATVYATIFWGSLVQLWGFDNTLTLENYAVLRLDGLQVLGTSLQLALVSSVPATVLGFLIAYLIARHRFTGRTALEVGSMLSFATPGTVMGIGYILAFNDGLLLLTGTGTILVLAFIFRNMPVAIRSGLAVFRQLDPSLEEASTTLRASTATTLWRVVVPLSRAAIFAGIIFSLVRAVTAVSQVIFLITPRYKLATVKILEWMEQGNLGRGAALATIMIVILALAILAAGRITRLLGGTGIKEREVVV
jgi:iron(III) transport system permease protein